ncbi:MAG: hypothetical protein PHI58_00115 [Candidatus Omnitrophica bacterium]|nr:hypothetical protein [Candidatus Omnitrophota bacterium]
MLTRIIPIFVSICLICGCGVSKKEPPAALKIDNINITTAEFDDAFKNSPYGSSDTPEMRKEFLNNFVIRMLILREAERTGMDKNPEFLKNVQFFWQQSLIKMMLDKKIKELASHINVTDAEVTDYYQANKDTEFVSRELPAVYEQIKWIILNKKQKALLDDWANSLRTQSDIDINYKLLKIEE